MKFTKEYVMCMGKHILIQKLFTNELNMGLPLQKTTHREETYWLSGREKVPREVVSKESHTDRLLGHEGIHHYWFP